LYTDGVDEYRVGHLNYVSAYSKLGLIFHSLEDHNETPFEFNYAIELKSDYVGVLRSFATSWNISPKVEVEVSN
jgi:hypothetical protein